VEMDPRRGLETHRDSSCTHPTSDGSQVHSTVPWSHRTCASSPEAKEMIPRLSFFFANSVADCCLVCE
jgi:hypothetical protein